MIRKVVEIIISKKRSIKDSFFYFGSSIVAFLLSIFTTPIFAKYFSYQDFAMYNYFLNIAGFFGVFFSLQFYSYYIAEYYRNTETENKKIAGSLIAFLLVWNLVIIGIIWLLCFIFLRRIKLSFPINPYLLICLIAVSCGIFKNFWLIQKRLKRESLNYFLISGISSILGIVLSLIFVIYGGNGARNRLLGYTIVEIFFAAAAIFYFLKESKFSIDYTDIRKGLTFCFPLILAGIIYYPIIGLDQFFLERRHNVKEIALYSIGLNFAGFLHRFNFSIFQALEPDIIRHCVNKEYSSLKKKVLGLTTIGIISCVIFNIFSKPIAAYLTHNKFTEAYKYANILVYSYLLVLIYSIVISILNATQDDERYIFNKFDRRCIKYRIILFFISVFWGSWCSLFKNNLVWTNFNKWIFILSRS